MDAAKGSVAEFAAPATSYELKITRTFDAPRELVWKAWTDPEMAKHWMGSRGFQTTEFVTSSDPGAPWHLTMEGHVPGTEHKVCLGQGGVVKEIKPPELLVYTFAWDSRESVGLGGSPYKENIVTVRLEEQGTKTVMHFTQAPFATAGERDGHTGGWNSAFDRIAELMSAEQPERVAAPHDLPSELHMKRVFAAPRQVVFDAWTKPEIVAQWWGPTGFTTPVCEMEARSGGAIRIHMRGPDGTIFPMTGKFVEFYPPYRFHFTSTPLDKDGNALFEVWNSVLFEEVEGGTQVTLDVHVTMMTAQAPQYLKGMTIGWSQTLDRLAKLLNSWN